MGFFGLFYKLSPSVLADLPSLKLGCQIFGFKFL